MKLRRMPTSPLKELEDEAPRGVLIVSYADYPGATGLSKRITGLRSVLSRRGIHNVVLCPFSRGTTEPNQSIVELQLALLGSLWNSPLGRMISLLVFSFLAIPSIVRYSLHGRLLIQYESLYSAFPSILAKMFLRRIVIGDEVILMSGDARPPISYVLYALDRLLIRNTDFLTTSSSSARMFVQACFPNKEIRFVPNGVRPTKREPSGQHDSRELIFVGAMSSSDNQAAVECILKIAQLLNGKEIRFHISIIGGPPAYVRPYLRNEMVRRGRVTFLGNVSDQELQKAYRRASIGLLPFFTQSQGGQRIKGLEYLANELLVVAGPFGFGIMPGLVAGTHYLKAGNPEEMCNHVAAFISNPRAYSKIAAEGREFVESNFSWEEVCKPYLNLITARIMGQRDSS